ncbi:MAG: hypothetical protein KF799_11665 [Bdellovibrionales bacterium]|nr:hypothetical protein [Bdellovibrionales bacterium]
MISLDERRLKLAMLPLNFRDRQYSSLYRQAMSCWEQVWGDLFLRHNVEHPLFLDQLFRQDEAACIYSGERCAALILFRTYDFEFIDYRHDSYFKEWNEGDLEVLLRHGKKVFATTYLTVHPDFRSFNDELKFKEVLLNLMIKRFKDSDADVISGVTRRDRGIHDESYKLGARLVRENVPYLGGRFNIDLVAFYKHEVNESQNPTVREICDRLWASKIDLAPNTAQKAA